MERKEKTTPLRSKEAEAAIQPSTGKTETEVPEIVKNKPEVAEHRSETENVGNEHQNETSIESTTNDRRQDNASKPEVSLKEPEVAEPAATKPEIATTETKSNEDEHESKRIVSDQQEIAKAEIEMSAKQEKPDANKTPTAETSSEVTSSEATSSQTKPDETQTDPKTVLEAKLGATKPEVPRQEPRTTNTTSGVVREKARPLARTQRSISNDSDTEISEILRNAPPPSVLSEEEEEGVEEEVEEEEGELNQSVKVPDGVGTEVIMKKTFTESIKPGLEFMPILDEFRPLTVSATPPHHLQHPVPSATTVADAVVSVVASSDSQTNDVERMEDDGKETADEEERGENILSKAQNEARDLTSELRRLQYLLENLSSFTELEIASFHPTPVPVDTVAKEDNDAITTDTVAKENKNTVTTDTVAKEDKNTVTTDTVAKEDKNPVITNSVAKEDKNTVTTDTVAKENKNAVTTDAVAKEDKDTVMTETVAKEGNETVTTGTVAKEDKNMVTKDTAAKEDKSTVTTDTVVANP